MKVILKADIKGVGRKDEIINASDGYARNYLFPKNLAVEANNANMAKLKSRNEAKAFKKETEKNAAQEIARKIESLKIVMKVKAGENGKIFGGITAKEIAEILKNKYSIEVDKKKILLNDTIKNIGAFTIDVKLYEGIVAKINLMVEAE